MLSIENQICNINVKKPGKTTFNGAYPINYTCGSRCAAGAAVEIYSRDNNLKAVDPRCANGDPTGNCPNGYNKIGKNVRLTNIGVWDPCNWPTYGRINQCKLNYDDQAVINAYDPLRSKLYSDNDKRITLNKDDPEFDVNIQKMFRCCAGTTKDKTLQEECGGYWRPTETTIPCNTNCKQTIMKYCTDLNHPERLLTKGSLCNKWANENDVSSKNDNDPTQAMATNLKYVAPYLKEVCQFDNKPDNEAYSNVTNNDYNDSCACYRPQAFYDTFLKSVAKKLGPKAMPFSPRPNPTCIWNACKTSALVPPVASPALTNIIPNVGGQCPAINIAACTTTVNNTNINTENPKVNIVNNQSCNINFGGDDAKKALDGVDDPDNSIPSDEPYNQPESDTDVDNKKGSKWWIFLIILILLIIGAGSAFFMFKKK